jgi:hypothetical protein
LKMEEGRISRSTNKKFTNSSIVLRKLADDHISIYMKEKLK